MPLFDHPSLLLEVLPGFFFVTKLEAGHDIPVKDLQGDSKFISITRTNEEISIVGEWREGMPDSYDHSWKCIKMRGPLDFGSYLARLSCSRIESLSELLLLAKA